MRRDKTTRDSVALPGGASVIHEDAELLVVDKPAGMIAGKPDDQTGKTLFHLIKQHVKAQGGHGRGEEGQRAWIIHRLDRDVSGLLVFAKTHTAYLALKDQLKRRQVQRRYLAVVAGEMPITPAGQWQWIDAFLEDAGPGKRVRLVRPPKGMGPRRPAAAKPAGEAGLRAITYYRVLAAGRGRSLLAVRLETGRKHQIRAHLAGEGHPIVSDRLYGGRHEPYGRLALHAWELAFAHPTTGQPAHFLAPPPAGFLEQVGVAAGVLQREAEEPAAEVAPPRREAGPAVSARREAAAAPKAKRKGEAGWDHVAGWYEELVTRHRSDYHEELVLPGVLRLLAPQPGQRVLDIACGEGLLCRHLAGLGCRCVGVDAAEHLVQTARRLAAPLAADMRPEFLVGDVRRLLELPDLARRQGAFDAATCVLSLMNMDPFEPAVRAAAALLAPGGSYVAIIMHPAFRAAGQTSWGYERIEPGEPQARAEPKSGPKPQRKPQRGPQRPGRRGERADRPEPVPMHQYRRVDAYLSPAHQSILMNPGAAAHGKPAITTITWHRPIQTYIKAFAEAGLLIDALEEWPSHRSSQPGPHAAEHDRARREIPMFLAMRGRRVQWAISGGI